ncbi:MAG TPA: Ig-like domain-containing domain [Chryseolinea sp.]|nr:Ig-like domain-containing domain [Chryseolinea sp.]
MKRIHYLQFFLLILTVFALSCARQTSPTGGPKDSIPPTVVRTIPEDQQINFQGQQIEATFSESVQLNNPKEQLIITPGVGKDFQASVKKNKVVVKLTKPLSPNTTYTISFREAVQDITEKNPAQNLHLAFSTGTYIDSLHLFGRVYEVLTAKEGKDATVGLYEQDTFNIFRHKPSYFTKADATGIFHLDNLKPGSYRVYAWLDNNKNLLVDSKSEAYGFLPETVRPQDSTYALEIPLVKLDARPLRITSARPSQTFFNIKTSKSTDYFSVTTQGTELYAAYGEDHENIRIYNTMTLQAEDSIPIAFIARDSLLQSIDTTLYLKFAQRTIKPQPFQMAGEQFSISGASGLMYGLLSFNKPVMNINYDSIYYRIDTTQIVKILPQDVHLDSMRTRLTITKQLDKSLLQPKPPVKSNTQQPKTTTPPTPRAEPRTSKTKPVQKKNPNNNELTIADGTFISAEGDSSKAMAAAIKPTTIETTGVIILEIKTQQRPLLVQLLSKGNVVSQQAAKTKTIFPDLQPGEYTLRVIVDTDQNLRWSPGNIFQNHPPEPIYFYMNEEGKPSITLKANWERELLITF